MLFSGVSTYPISVSYCGRKHTTFWGVDSASNGRMCTRNLPGGEGRPARKVDNLTAICEPIVWELWEPRRLTALWVSTTCFRDSFAVFYLRVHYPVLSDTRDVLWPKAERFEPDFGCTGRLPITADIPREAFVH
jgi:hypothetical protein